MGQRDVLIDPELERQTLALAVLGQVADAGLYGVAGIRDVQPLALELDGPRVYLVGPEDCPRELRAPRPDEPGETQDLPGADLEGAVLEYVAAGDPFGAQHHVPDLDFRFGIEVTDVATDHQPDQLVLIQLADRQGVHELAVAHDGDAVAYAEDLVEAV